MLAIKDYVRYRLTGVLAQEISDASGTNLLDVPARRWSAEIMDKLGLDMALLPPLVESCEAAGAVTPEAAEKYAVRVARDLCYNNAKELVEEAYE